MYNTDKKKQIFIIIECLFLGSIIAYSGIKFFPYDPMFLKSTLSPSLFASVVFALFYGFYGSICWFLLLALGSFLLYEEPEYYSLAWNLLIMLTIFEFHNRWIRRFKELQISNEYTKRLLSRLKREFTLLKLSHDELERNYITKPYCFRDALRYLKTKALNTDNELSIFSEFMNLVSKHFGVNEACIYKFENNKLNKLVCMGKDFEITEEDLKCIEDKEAKCRFLTLEDLIEAYKREFTPRYIFLSISENENGKYILAIRDIDFGYMKEDVFSNIDILFNYVTEYISAGLYKINGEPDFALDFIKLHNIYKRTGIVSSYVILKTPYIDENTKLHIENAVRVTDTIEFIEESGKIVCLLPFTRKENAHLFAERIRRKIKHVELEDVGEIKEVPHILRTKEVANL